MDRKLASNIRKIALVLMIVFDVLMLVALWFAGQTVCFWMFSAINLIVILAEVINSLWVYKKTVSTQLTKTLEQEKEKRWIIYAGLICFMLSMISLFVHWVVW